MLILTQQPDTFPNARGYATAVWDRGVPLALANTHHCLVTLMDTLYSQKNAESQNLESKVVSSSCALLQNLSSFSSICNRVIFWEGRDEDRREGGRKGKTSDASDFLSENKSKLLFQVFKALQTQAWLPVFLSLSPKCTTSLLRSVSLQL